MIVRPIVQRVVVLFLLIFGADESFVRMAIGQLLHPIILIPGSGGNQLEARLTESYKHESLFCYPNRRTKKWFRLWLDVSSLLLPPLTKCFAHRMALVYDPLNDSYSNIPGVETRVPFFGSVQGIDYLDPNLKPLSGYMSTLIESLNDLGYVNDQNLFGAPYDFRHGLGNEHTPSVGSKFLEDLKTLVEKASSINGGKKVILISHSLGGLWTHQLLLKNSLSWRRNHIQHFISLSTPWGGTVQELIVFGSGSTLGVPFVDPLTVRQEQRSSESNLWLMPSPEVYGDKPLVITTAKVYSALNVSEFLVDVGFEEGVGPYTSRIRPLMSRVEAPLIPVTCVVGTGVETPETLVYGRKGTAERWFDEQPDVVYGDGDGTVNTVSLLRVEDDWREKEGEQFLKVVKVDGVSHTSVLKEIKAVREIIEEVRSINSMDTQESCLL